MVKIRRPTDIQSHERKKIIDVCPYKIHDPNKEEEKKENKYGKTKTTNIKLAMFILVSNGEPAKETL